MQLLEKECVTNQDYNAIKLKSYLHQFKLKITYGMVKESYTTSPTPRVKVEDSLGFSTSTSTSTSVSPQRTKEELFQVWQNDPLLITSEELELVQTFRFENDLMSASEEQLYLNQLMS
jgi:hypothetical protein